MTAPWEKYKTPPATGPWAKYGEPPAAPEEPGFFEKAGAVASAFGDYAIGGAAQSLGGLARSFGEDPRGMLGALSPFSGMQDMVEGAVGQRRTEQYNPIPDSVPGLARFGQELGDTGRFQEGDETLRAAGVEEDSLAASLARSGGSVAPMGLGVGLGLLSRSPTLGAAAMGASAFGSSYQESRDGVGLDVDDAQKRSAIQAGVETVAERLGLKYILPKPVKEAAESALDKIINKNVATKIAGAATAGAIEETATSAAQMGLDEALGYADYSGQDYRRALQDAAVGGSALSGAVRAATVFADAKKPTPIEIPDTGVPAFDAGKQSVADLQRARDSYVAPDNKDTNLNEGPKMPDLFSRTPDVPSAQDMFSGEVRAIEADRQQKEVTAEARLDRQRPWEIYGEADPALESRTPERQAELEQDYIFQQQEKLKEEVRRRMLARKERELPAVDTSDMGMTNIVREGQPTSVSERPDLVRRKITDDTINELGFSDDGKNILTREGNPLNIDEWRLLNKEIETRMSVVMGSTAPARNNTTMADAFDRAGLRRNTGLLEERGFESEATYPNARGGAVQQPQDGPAVFEPSRVPQAEGRAPIQQEMQMPDRDINEPLAQPGLFDAPVSQQAKSTVAPAATTVAPKAPAGPDLAAILRERNERSIKETGQPLTDEQVSELARGQAAKAEGLPTAAVASSPVDHQLIEYEDEKETNDAIRARMKEDAGIRAAITAETDKGAGASVENVMRAVAKAKGANEYQQRLAFRLGAAAKELGLSFVAQDADPYYTNEKGERRFKSGSYLPAQNAIRINSANPETLLHEVAHGISKAILADPEIQAKNPKLKEAVDDLKALFGEVTLETAKRDGVINQYPKLKASMVKYGTKNIDEFFAMAMTNPEFQKFLASIPSKGNPRKSMWQSLKDVVKRLLGLGRIEGSALDRAMDRTFEIADFASQNPEQVREATGRMQGRIQREQADKQRRAEAEELKAKGDKAGALRKILEKEEANQEVSTEEPARKIPVDRGQALNTIKRILSAKWGRIFGEDFEWVQGQVYSGKEAAQRVYRAFDSAGYAKLSEGDKQRVSLAMDGKADISDLSPKMQAAVKDYRARILADQLRLAAESKDESLKNMIYESAARGDWSTRAYAAFDLKPDSLDSVLYFMHQLGTKREKGTKGETAKPYWLWKQEKDAPQAVKALESYVRDGLVIPDITSMDDKGKGILAAYLGLQGTEAEIDAALEKERARLGADEDTQVFNIVRLLSDPLNRQNADVRLDKQAARDMTILMSRKDVPKVIREFWGEFNQAPLKGAMSISRLTKLVAQTKMINNIVMDGTGNYLFPEGMTAKPGYTEQLPKNEAMGALGGMYTRPDIAKQLETLVDTTSAHANREFAQAAEVAWKAWTKVIIPTKVVATVMNAPTAMANLVASTSALPGFYFRSALMGKPIKGLKDTVTAATTAMWDASGRLKEKEARAWIEAGILREGVQLGELNDMIQQYEWDAQIQKGGSATAKAFRRTAKGADRTMGFFKTTYQIADNMLRLQAASIEYNMQKLIHPETSEAELRKISADRAKDQVPTWSRSSPLVRRVGVALGSFPTFFSEVIRTISHQYAQGFQDVATGLKEGNKKQTYYGFVQLSATTFQVGVMKMLMATAMAAAFGLDEEDERKSAALEASLPDYQRGNNVSALHVDPKTMRVVYTNTDRIDLAGPINTTIGRLRQTKEFSDIPEELLQIVMDAAGFGPGAQAWRDAVAGSDEYGNRLSGGERMQKVGEAYIPRTVAWFDKLQAMERRGVSKEVIEAGKWGLPLYELDSKTELKNASYDFKRDVNAAEDILQRAVGKVSYGRLSEKMEPLETEELKDAYLNFLLAEKEAFDGLSDRVQAAKVLYGPQTRSTIAGIFKDTTVPKVYREPLQSGKFKARDFTARFLASARTKALEKDPGNTRAINQRFDQIQKTLNQHSKNFKALLGE